MPRESTNNRAHHPELRSIAAKFRMETLRLTDRLNG